MPCLNEVHACREGLQRDVADGINNGDFPNEPSINIDNVDDTIYKW